MRIITFTLLVLSISLPVKIARAKEYIIYSIAHEIPMGIDDEKLKTNFYINIGENQGIAKGAIVDVFRTVSRLDPFHSNHRYNYRVNIGQMKVIHVGNESSISSLVAYNKGDDTPLVEIKKFMIGDRVEVHLNKD